MVSSATELLLSHSILHPNYYREVNLFEIGYLGVKKAAKSAKSLLTEHRYYYSCYAGTATTMLTRISNFLGHISNCGRQDMQPACTSSLPNRCALLLGQTAALLFSLASNCRLLLWVIFEKWTSSCCQHKLSVTCTSLVSLAVNKLHPCLKGPV